MKIIIGDAKTHNPQPTGITPTTPVLFDQAQPIIAKLHQLSALQLEKQFKISPKLATQLYHNYHQAKATPALASYDGIVFKQFNQLDDAKILRYLNSKLRIVSPLYGLLKPSDQIIPYRLSMTDKVAGNLYDYYQNVNDILEDEDFLVLLCSQEFVKLLCHPNMYFIDFIEFDHDKIKRPGAHVKEARGQMVRHMALDKITTLGALKKIEIDEFKFDAKLSSKMTLVFSRQFKTKK